jgi:CRISPR-associated protein Cas2
LTVIVAEKVSAGLRGLLTRWMLEVHPGVFVGTLSTRVREVLWATITKPRRRKTGAFLLIHNASNEQRFHVVSCGTGSRATFDCDGLLLTGRTASPAPGKGEPSDLAVRSPEERLKPR